MAYTERFSAFSIVRQITPDSRRNLLEFISDTLPEEYSDYYEPLSGIHLSLFKLPMLSKNARKNYRVLASQELENRVYDEPNPEWDPFSNRSLDLVRCRAFGDRLMLFMEEEDVKAEHNCARRAARVSRDMLAGNFDFTPHIAPIEFHEHSTDSVDKIFEAEEVLHETLAASPFEVEFQPVVALAAMNKHSKNQIHHRFVPKNAPQFGGVN